MITLTKPSLPDFDEYVQYLKRIWETKMLTNSGEYVLQLKKNMQTFLGVKELVLVSNGTMALHLGIKSLDLRGEIITTPFTFAATTNAINWEGLKPIFADIDQESFTIKPEEVRKKITQKTSAILAVHVFGNPCEINELTEIATEHNLKLIFDGAHCFGVEHKNQSVLSYGDISTLSFHATKVFNTIEGGALVTKDKDLAEKIKLLSDHGINAEGRHICVGTNAKMNEFQAAMGLCNLEQVHKNIGKRRLLYERYKDRLSNLNGIEFQKIKESTKYNYCYMPVLFETKEIRDRICFRLAENRVEARKYFYPLTISYEQCSARQNHLIRKYNLPVSFAVAERVLCLPIYPELPSEQVDRIAEIIISTLFEKR